MFDNNLYVYYSILYLKTSNGNIMPLCGIDINPMNPNEFIINGGDELIRMYDKRKLSIHPAKQFCRLPITTIVSQFIV